MDKCCKYFLTFYLLVTVGCSSLLYQPTYEQHFDPEQMNVKYQDLWFKNANGNKINAWYFESKSRTNVPAQAVIVFFHGNGENLSSHFLNLLWILDDSYDYMIFDYAGYGRSEGSPSPEGTVLDGIAAIEWVHKNKPTLPIVILGQSLGGAVAMRSAIELRDSVPISLVVVESSFESYQDAGNGILANTWFTWPFQWLAYLLLSDTYAPEGMVDRLAPIPLIVIHGEQDDVVDIELGQAVFKNAVSPKEFWKVPQGKHINSFWQKDLKIRKKLLDVLKKIKNKEKGIPSWHPKE